MCSLLLRFAIKCFTRIAISFKVQIDVAFTQKYSAVTNIIGPSSQKVKFHKLSKSVRFFKNQWLAVL